MPSPPPSILQPLSPRVAVLASDDVADSCAANGCRGLEELLRPWEGGTDRVSILSSTLTPTVHPTFPLRFVNYASVYSNPTATSWTSDVVVDLIGSCVGKHRPDEEQHYPLTRALLFASRPLGSHETFQHPVGVLMAISTSTPDPMGTLTRLYGQAVGGGAQAAPWMDGVTVLRFFVVVHDVSKMGEDLTHANELLSQVKKLYGPHSTLLVINSRTPDESAFGGLGAELTGTPAPAPHASYVVPSPDVAKDPDMLSATYASAMASFILSPTAAAAGASTPSVTPSHSPALGASPVSAPPPLPPKAKVYGQLLSPKDVQNIVALIRELVVQSLVPWMEARVREWSEAYASNRRGLTGRLFGAGRKLFGSRPASPAPNAGGYNPVKGYYPASSPEALARRLADFSFMLRDYRHAQGIYDSLRRDYTQDRAWRHVAASGEMLGLCQLLGSTYFLPTSPAGMVYRATNAQHAEIAAWLEQAAASYLSRAGGVGGGGSVGGGTGTGGTPTSPTTSMAASTGGKTFAAISLDALRVTLLYYEAWKACGEWRGVGAALVRAAGEADEAACAIALEEASNADVKGGRAGKGHRRQAFHLALAARRYEKAGLKPFSRRCLERASSLISDGKWPAARERIEYSLGRQAYSVSESDAAVEHFLNLLKRYETAADYLPPTPTTAGLGFSKSAAGSLEHIEHATVSGSQGMILADLALAYEQLASRPDELAAAREAGQLELPTPVFDVSKTRIERPEAASGPGAAWTRLERKVLGGWAAGVRTGKKPVGLLPDRKHIVAAVGETFQVELVASNPLNAPLVVSNLTLLTNGSASAEILPDIMLAPYESRTLALSLTLTAAGPIEISHASYLFHRFLPVRQSLARRGRRLHTTKAQRLEPTYAPDTSLTIHAEEGVPRLRVELIGVPPELYEGETVKGVVRLTNVGGIGVEDVALVPNIEGLLSLSERFIGNRTDFADDEGQSPTTAASTQNTLRPKQSLKLHASLPAGETADVPVIFTAPATGRLELLALVVFSTADGHTRAARLAHRVDVRRLFSIAAGLTAARTGYFAALEITNHAASPLRLASLNPVSLAWETDAEVPGEIVYANQTLRTILRITPKANTKGLDLTQRDLVANFHHLLSGSGLQPIKPAEVKLDLPSGAAGTAFLASRQRHRRQFAAESLPGLPEDQVNLVLPMWDPLDLDLALSWTLSESEDDDRMGYAAVHSLRPAPAFSVVGDLRAGFDFGAAGKRTMYEETGRLRRALENAVLEGAWAIEENPITSRVKVPDNVGGKVTFDFSRGPLLLPIDITLENRSPHLSARWLLNLPVPNTGHAYPPHTYTPGTTSAITAGYGYGGTQPPPPITGAPPLFTGALSHRGTLPPGESATVRATAWVTEPSLLALSGWEVLSETGDHGDVDSPAADVHAAKRHPLANASGGVNTDTWKPRASWSVRGHALPVEIVQE